MGIFKHRDLFNGTYLQLVGGSGNPRIWSFAGFTTYPCLCVERNNTAIDGCYTTEGGYCLARAFPSERWNHHHVVATTSTGDQSLQRLRHPARQYHRSKVTAATCLSACPGSPTPSCTDGIQNGQETGVDCGGPSCPPCPAGCLTNSGTLTIVLTNYPSETTWNIKMLQLLFCTPADPYSAVGGTVTVPLCLPNACYTFNIFDSYGDGICCACKMVHTTL